MGISRESQETREFRPYYGERPDAADEGIGVGGALYKPGDGAAVVDERARALVAAWQSARTA